ncbi:hypothetical protein L596_005430 [Steinernema carpocapsae]|uniref:Uncharacterized protein n=1 Tax=Steinernema carpocapsae TaxID=34508 RepID=A0A4U8V0F8_STECR|nr:hypothetical protein L596_005430 [Steinernema carpocapsae]
MQVSLKAASLLWGAELPDSLLLGRCRGSELAALSSLLFLAVSQSVACSQSRRRLLPFVFAPSMITPPPALIDTLIDTKPSTKRTSKQSRAAASSRALFEQQFFVEYNIVRSCLFCAARFFQRTLFISVLGLVVLWSSKPLLTDASCRRVHK